MNNLQKSLEFYITARLALSERVEKNPFLIEAEKKVTKNFLQNEASDYQILNLVVHESLPEEKYNNSKEWQLINQIKALDLELLEGLAPLFEANLTSQKLVLEYLIQNKNLNEFQLRDMALESAFVKISNSLTGSKPELEEIKPTVILESILNEIRPKWKSAMSIAGLMGYFPASLPIWAVYRKIRSRKDVCTKKCGTYELNTVRRQKCMHECKVKEIEAQIKMLQGHKKDCDKLKDKKGKDPAKCKQRVDASIKQLKEKLVKAKKKVKDYEERSRKKGLD